VGPHLTQCGQGQGLPPYQVASWSIQSFGHSTSVHGPKSRRAACCRAPAFFGGGRLMGPHITQCRLGRGLRTSSTKWHRKFLIHLAVWPQPTKWGLCRFGGARSPSNTMWPGSRPTSTPSFILIHPTVWPQYTNVTDKTGQTGQTTVR